jgi:dTDP-4-dehydrorhamnose 3,5-epimerase/reductase
VDQSSILIIGATGQLSKALQVKYPQAMVVSSSALNIADAEAVANYNWAPVKYILNAGAYTNVDGAETPEGRIAAWQVNAVGARNLAAAALKYDLTLVHVSTDYVFDGTKNPHTEDEPLSPLGVYGQSKAAGDLAIQMAPKHYLLRTSWVIGDGKNFVRTMIGLGQKGIAPSVVADQIGRLTFTSELARAIDHLLTTLSPYGTYNVSNGGGTASWADITREIFRLGSFDLTVTDTTTAEYFASKPESAPRPLLSILDLSKLEATGFKPAGWLEDLEAYVTKELQNS